jgi:hypothetical protein
MSIAALIAGRPRPDLKAMVIEAREDGASNQAIGLDIMEERRAWRDDFLAGRGLREIGSRMLEGIGERIDDLQDRLQAHDTIDKREVSE